MLYMVSQGHIAQFGYRVPEVRSTILLLIIGIVLYLCWAMLRPFVSVITWATALAILTYPLSVRLERHLNPTRSAFIAVLLVVMLVVVPVLLLSIALLDDIAGSLGALAHRLNPEKIQRDLQQRPDIAGVLEWATERLDLDQQIQNAAGTAARSLSGWVSSSVWVITQLILTFLALFYFVRDRSSILSFFRRFTPFSVTATDELCHRIAQAVEVSLYRNLLVRLLQGFLGGVMFWILVCHHPSYSAPQWPFLHFCQSWGPRLYGDLRPLSLR